MTVEVLVWQNDFCNVKMTRSLKPNKKSFEAQQILWNSFFFFFIYPFFETLKTSTFGLKNLIAPNFICEINKKWALFSLFVVILIVLPDMYSSRGLFITLLLLTWMQNSSLFYMKKPTFSILHTHFYKTPISVYLFYTFIQ